MQVALVFTKHAVSPALTLSRLRSGVQEEWVTAPPPPHTHRRHPPGDSGPVTGNSSLCFLEVLPPTTLSLKTKTKTNQVYIIIKRSCEEALFSFG